MLALGRPNVNNYVIHMARNCSRRPRGQGRGHGGTVRFSESGAGKFSTSGCGAINVLLIDSAGGTMEGMSTGPGESERVIVRRRSLMAASREPRDA